MKLHSNMRPRPKAMALSIQASLAMGLTLGAAVAPHPAEAQARMIEEIVVTARKREESLQDTPVAITAFSGDRLRESGIYNVSDLNRFVPNIDVGAGSGNAGAANIYIRGVGQRNTEPNLDSGVGMYLDGVYISRADGALLDINDLASLEVLRGPQGTLFGKNTTGGALVFNTNRPGPEIEASVLGRVGNFNRRDAELMVNLPLVDDLLYTRLSMVSRKRDGYVKNALDGRKYNDEDRISAVWQLRWLPHDMVTVDFNTSYSKTAQNAQLQECIIVDEAQDTAWQTKSLNDYVRRAYGADVHITDFCQQLGRYRANSTGGEYNAENVAFSTTIDWDITDNISFKSVSAWRGVKAGQDDPLDALPIPLLLRSNYAHPFAEERDSDQYSQEFQLLGDAMGGRLRWVTGLYAFRETIDSTTVNMVGPLQFNFAVPGVGPVAPNRYFYNATATPLSVDNESWSAFAQMDFNITDSLILTAGLRFTDERRELEMRIYEPDPTTLGILPDGTIVPGLGLAGSQWNLGPNNLDARLNPNHSWLLADQDKRSVKDSAWTPMVSLQYLLPETAWLNNGMVYVTYSEGFRSGGLSEAPGGTLSTFKPEEVENYEIGIKLDLWDNRIRLNASAFYMDYTNRQLTTVTYDVVNSRPAGATINAEDSNIRGIELESIIMPLPNLEIGFNATWSKGKIKQYDDVQISYIEQLDWLLPPALGGLGGVAPEGCEHFAVLDLAAHNVLLCDIDRSDENLPRLPESTYMLSAQYFLETPVGTFIPRIQGSWKYDMDNCFDRRGCQSGKWFTRKQFNLDARLTWMSHDQKWMVAAYGTNLTKEDYVVGGTPLVDALGFGGRMYAPPRMYGMEVQYTY